MVEGKKSELKYAETVSKRKKLLLTTLFGVLPWFIAAGLGFVHDAYKIGEYIMFILLCITFSPVLVAHKLGFDWWVVSCICGIPPFIAFMGSVLGFY